MKFLFVELDQECESNDSALESYLTAMIFPRDASKRSFDLRYILELMVQKGLAAAAALLLLFGSCRDHGKEENAEQKQTAVDSLPGTDIKASDVPYSVAKNYFVKNSVKQTDLKNSKIEVKEGFDEFFGPATRMGTEGKPTEIDFSRQYVIAVLGKETDSATEIIPVSLKRDDKNQIILNYRVKRGARQTFKIRPSLIVLVDKSNHGTVITKEQID